MSMGDGVAEYFGKRLGGPRWPFNVSKSFAGSFGFFMSGTLGSIALCGYLSTYGFAPVEVSRLWWVCVVASAVCAFGEVVTVG